MINLTYKDFMKLIKQKRLFLMQFHIKGYNHYNSCVIRTSYDNVNSNLKIYLINCILTKDKTEIVSFFNNFKEDYKLFKFGKEGNCSLRMAWNKIEIDAIEEQK